MGRAGESGENQPKEGSFSSSSPASVKRRGRICEHAVKSCYTGIRNRKKGGKQVEGRGRVMAIESYLNELVVLDAAVGGGIEVHKQFRQHACVV
jgi:hypothetical protein